MGCSQRTVSDSGAIIDEMGYGANTAIAAEPNQLVADKPLSDTVACGVWRYCRLCVVDAVLVRRIALSAVKSGLSTHQHKLCPGLFRRRLAAMV